MFFSDIPGNAEVKARLSRTIVNQKVAHAQLFSGKTGGAGLPLALAYAALLTCEDPKEGDACGHCPACEKNKKFVHPDVQFVMPVTSTANITGDAVISVNFIKQWREFMQNSPYGDINDWVSLFGGANKAPTISRRESHEIIKNLSLKPFEAEYKVMIIWMPELMHASAANGILKILEEPAPKTVFLLVTYAQEKLLQTIQSRAQIVIIPPVKDNQLSDYLVNSLGADPDKSLQVARLADGSIGKAIRMISNIEDGNEEAFQEWMRSCFTMNFEDLIAWSDRFSAMSKLAQRNFILLGTSVLRDVLMFNGNQDLVRSSGQSLEFVRNFSKVMDLDKIERIFKEMEQSGYYLERNANAKVIFMDLSISIGKILKQKSKVEA